MQKIFLKTLYIVTSQWRTSIIQTHASQQAEKKLEHAQANQPLSKFYYIIFYTHKYNF
jgi:hypothetical protein